MVVVSPQNQQLVIFVLKCILLTFFSRLVIPEREDKNDVQSNKKKKKEKKKKKKKKKHKKKSGEPSPASSGSDSDTIYPSDLLKKAESTPPRYMTSLILCPVRPRIHALVGIYMISFAIYIIMNKSIWTGGGGLILDQHSNRKMLF